MPLQIEDAIVGPFKKEVIIMILLFVPFLLALFIAFVLPNLK